MSGRVCVKIDHNAYAGRNQTKILTAELASFFFSFFFLLGAGAPDVQFVPVLLYAHRNIQVY